MIALSSGLTRSARSIAASRTRRARPHPTDQLRLRGRVHPGEIVAQGLSFRGGWAGSPRSLRTSSALEADRERLGQATDASAGQHDARHERAAIDRVVADRQRLALAAEDDLLMGDEPGEPDRVDRLVDVGAGVAEQLGRPGGRARGLVELAVVVELDDLDLRHVLGDPLAELHHQDRADREVGGDEGAAALAAVPVPLGALLAASRGRSRWCRRRR